MVAGCTLLVPLAAHYLTARSIPSDFPFIKKFANFISLISRKLAMACKRGGSLFLQSISSSLIRNRNHNTRALSICNGKRTSHPNTVSINKMEEAQGIPTEQAKATSTEEVPNENAQSISSSLIRNRNYNTREVPLSICNGKRTSLPNTASISKLDEAQGIPTEQVKVLNENAQVLRIESVEKKLVEYEFRQAEERSKADKAFSDLKKEIDELKPKTNIAYYFACTGFLVILAKCWL